MAEAIKGCVILKSVPNREVEFRVSAYLAEVFPGVPVDRIVHKMSRSKPLTLIRDVDRNRGQVLAQDLNDLGASACFLLN